MALRMVELVLPHERAPEIESLSQELAVLGHWREVLENGLILWRVLVESEKTEAVLETLQGRFRGEPGFRLVIFAVEAILPRPEPAEPPPAQDEKPEPEPSPQRIACAELVEQVSGSVAINRVYALTVILSTIVAAIGLLRDNVAVIIGAMVIAPLLGPNMTLSVATTLGDPQLARQAIKIIGLGLALAIFVAALMGLLVHFDPQIPQIATRTEVGLSDVALALAAGSAGALAFTSGLSVAVVGVMVAVALLPPLTAAGLLLGSALWSQAAGALLLTATNVICINLAGVATFLAQGVRPRNWWQAHRAKRMVRIAAAVWVALLALLVALILLASK